MLSGSSSEVTVYYLPWLITHYSLKAFGVRFVKEFTHFLSFQSLNFLQSLLFIQCLHMKFSVNQLDGVTSLLSNGTERHYLGHKAQ